MKCTNRQFGELEFDEKHVVAFPEGIIGFEEYRKYLIIDDEDSQPFRWLVSIEDEDLSFAMIDPGRVVADFQSSQFKNREVTVFLLVAIKDPLQASTTNLKSPLVIDNALRVGRQVILDDETLSVRYPLFARHSEIVE